MYTLMNLKWITRAFLVVSATESTCSAGDPCLIRGSKNPLEESMANHSSILAWRIPWTKEPGSRKELDTTEATEHTHARTPRTSPVIQWLRIQLPKYTSFSNGKKKKKKRIRLPMQETQVRSLGRKIPHALGQLSQCAASV